MDFTTTPHGCLPVGTKTQLGIIERVSLTAYLVNGQWVPFTKIHGEYKGAVEPLAAPWLGRRF